MKTCYTSGGILICLMLGCTTGALIGQNKVGINTTAPKETAHIMGGLLAEGQILVGASDSVITYIMGAGPSSASDTSGVLYDSGGPAGAYGNNEDLFFTVQGTGNILYLRVMVDSMEMEAPYDRLILAWSNGMEDTLTGTSTGVYQGVHPLTIHFHSNEVNTGGGFKLQWNCIFPGLEDSLQISGVGGRFHWIQGKYALRSGFVNGNQWDADHIGDYSLATGYNPLASGAYSLAMGYGTNASGISSMALGRFSTASASYSTALGNNTTASGEYATAMGLGSEASGNNATAFGFNTDASGNYTTALGVNTMASGGYSTAMGNNTTASGYTSTSMGYYTNANGNYTTAFGAYTDATGVYSTALGWLTDAHASTSVVLGRFNVGGGNPNDWVDTDPLFEIGIGTSASDSANAMTIFKNGGALWGGEYSGTPDPPPAEGAGTRMMWYPNKGAFRAGTLDAGGATYWNKDSIGIYSTAMGIKPRATGTGAVAFGFTSAARGDWSVAMGVATLSEGYGAFAMGNGAKAMGDYSLAFGTGTQASGYLSFAHGSSTSANGTYSTSFGNHTSADAHSAFALGRYNVGGGNSGNWMATDPLFEIGIGISAADSANAMTIFKNAGALWGGVYSGTPDPPPAEGAGTRMMWYPGKAAFRAGDVDGTQWNKDSIGIYSFAAGRNTKAKGEYSVALGWGSRALANYSTAIGYFVAASGVQSTALGSVTEATADYSTALGFSTHATGYGATALGSNTWATGEKSTAMGHLTSAAGLYATSIGLSTDADAYASVVLGRYNVGGGTAGSWVATDPLFEIGIGANSGSLANALTVLKNGKVGIGIATPVVPLHVDGGSDVTLSGGGYFQIGPSNGSNMGMDNNEIATRNNGLASTLFINPEGGHIILGGSSTDYVGIGTNNPTEKLHVNGGAKIDGTTFVVDEVNNRVGIGTTGPLVTLDVVGGARVDGTTFVVDEVNNRVGIGTSAPLSDLHVEGTVRARKVMGKDSDGLQLAPDSGTPSVYVQDDGNVSFVNRVAIGDVPLNTHRLYVRSSSTGSSGASAYIKNTATSGIALSIENTSTSSNDNVLLVSSQGSTGDLASFDSWHGTGVWDREFRFTNTGDGRCDGSWITGGADYAEFFPMAWPDEQLEAGDVISISEQAGYTVEKSHGDKRQLLLGVYSTMPAVIGNSSAESDPEDAALVGLIGVVPTKVCSENGPIHIGDFVTLSSVDGVAARAISPGMMIGRAMEDFDAAIPGLIKVMVQPQWVEMEGSGETAMLRAEVEQLKGIVEELVNARQE